MKPDYDGELSSAEYKELMAELKKTKIFLSGLCPVPSLRYQTLKLIVLNFFGSHKPLWLKCPWKKRAQKPAVCFRGDRFIQNIL